MRWQSEIRKLIDGVLQSTDTPRIAVFDADGTLWNDDLGEAFFKYQIQNHLAPGILKIKDPWQHYKNMVIRDHHAAYGWLAQINEGLPESTLKSHCTDFFKRNFKQKIFPEIRTLIEELLNNQFEVWVCSASIRWVIDAGAVDLGVSQSRVIAVETQVNENGIITNDLITPLPYGSGKKYRLNEKLSRAPLFVAGNSMGDLDMLTLASQVPLVINYLPHLPEIKSSEEALLKEATARGWPVQSFS